MQIQLYIVLYPTCQSFSHHIYLKCWHSLEQGFGKSEDVGTHLVSSGVCTDHLFANSNVFCIVLYFTNTHTQKYCVIGSLSTNTQFTNIKFSRQKAKLSNFIITNDIRL